MRGGYIRQERPYVTFAALFVSEKREKKKSFFMFIRGRTMFDPTSKSPKYSQQKKQKIYTPSRQRTCQSHARPSFSSGRADNACTNLLGSFVRYVRTRGSMRFRGAAKPPIFALSFAARTRHVLLLATNSCTRKKIFKRMENPLK